MNIEKEIQTLFGLKYISKGNIAVRCVVHNDTRLSGSVNFQKKVFHCFAGCGGFSFKGLLKKLNDNKSPEVKEEIVQQAKLVKPTKENFKQFISKRKISDKTLKELGAAPVFDANSDKYGYLVFPYSSNGGYVARSFCNHELRYVNSYGEKGLFGYKKGMEEVFLVEGIFDLCAMHELGYKNVVCSLGSNLSKQQAYLLRKVTVYIMYDLDYSGWSGAIDAAKLLNEVGANPIIIELPEGRGKDVNEMYINNKKGLQAFIAEAMAKYDVTDIPFVAKLFAGKDRPLTMFPTGVKPLDKLLNGGMMEGIHAITGIPATGKSALNLFLATRFVQAGANVLYATYEISTRQCWSRVASIFSKMTWADIEKYPERLEKVTKQKMAELAKKLKIVAGWRATEIKRVSKNYDVIFVDYIQRMPGISEDSLVNINLNLNILSDLTRDEAKIVMVVSSVPRAKYDQEHSLGAFKDSGNIEYQAQTATRLHKLTDDQIKYVVIKNTRGPVGEVQLESNLASLNFK